MYAFERARLMYAFETIKYDSVEMYVNKDENENALTLLMNCNSYKVIEVYYD
jgi:hypothetical protein